MVLGVLLVGGLVVWALTRTVEVTPTPAPATTASVPAESTAATATPGAIPPGAITTSTALPVTATNAPHPPDVHGDRSTVQRIAVEDLRAKMNRNEVTVIDVRDANSYSTQHIAGAINVPFASIESMLSDIPKDKPIVTYCT